MRKDVAQCLYNFSNAPIKASISVITANGEEIVATEQIAERNDASGEWITLGKYGFTFSSPKLKVKLTQEKIAAPATTTVQPAPAPKPASPTKKNSITCIKGKLKKIVTGSKPKCPTGYRVS